MNDFEQQYLADLREHARGSRTLLSNKQKAERERMVVRAFLRCLGVPFANEEVQPSREEPIDIVFRSARFQLMDIVGDRKRGDEWRQRERKYDGASSLSELLEPWTGSEALSLTTVVRLVADKLEEKARHYGQASCAKLDALVYVDIHGQHLWPLDSPAEKLTEIDEIFARQGWRSVSMLYLPYGAVLYARTTAPDFLKDKVGRAMSEWRHSDGWFDE
jgi:hypothetical protein